MDKQHSTSSQNKNLFASFTLMLIFVLITPVAQASTGTSESLLPPTLTETLEQTEQQENKALTQSEIIDQATSQSADAHIITKNKDGSVRIPSPMQDVIATLTARGASIHSDDEAGENFALLVNGLGREKSKLTKIHPGKISSDEKIARLFHNNLIEEFSTSSEGIRQDFVVPTVPTVPKGKGKLVVELDIEGATARLDKKGAMLTLKNGRELAYHSLMVADAAGKTLPAHFAVKNKQTLHIVVDDAGAQYPVRIDPTITDADWFSMGAAVPEPWGVPEALVSDGMGNLYIGGSFEYLAGVANTQAIAKWDGNSWSALGSGLQWGTGTRNHGFVTALAWDGTNLYAGGNFTTAGDISANRIAKWDGSSWGALGSGLDDTVRSLTWNGTNLYAEGNFTTAGDISANRIAQWDGSVWRALGSGMNSWVYSLAWDGTNLYAGGNFTTAGGKETGYVAGLALAELDPLFFADLTDVTLNTVTSSEVLNITGILIDVDISITNGEYSLNGNTFTSVAGTVSNNDSLQLRTTSSASYNTTTDVVISVGDGGDTWSVTTLTDTVPETFSFTDQDKVARSSLITSDAVTITGLGASSPISITGGEYSINDGAYTSADGFINNNDTVTLRTISSDERKTALDVVLDIGGVNDTFTVTTHAGNSDNAGSLNFTWLILPFFITACRRRLRF